MPARPLKPCNTPGCPGKALSEARCEPCKRKRRADTDQRRGNASERGYDWAWRRSRLAYLLAHPRCVLCGQAAGIADHYPLSRRQLIADGVPDPDAWHRLRALCKPCHDVETARLQPGGWARERRAVKGP